MSGTPRKNRVPNIPGKTRPKKLSTVIKSNSEPIVARYDPPVPVA